MSKHVIFGTGALGRAVMRALIAEQASEIVMVNRSGKRAGIPDQVDVVAADACEVNTVIALTSGADVVYQCAQPAYYRWQTDFPPLQTAIVKGVSATGAKLIVGENLYGYGAVTGDIHENLPMNAHTRKGKVRAAMTRELMDAYEKGLIQVAIARGSDFYGRYVRQSALGERVFEFMLKGKAAQVTGNPDLPHTYTVIDDFGAAMVILGKEPAAIGEAWHVPNPPTQTTRALIEYAAKLVEIDVKIAPAGKNAFRFFGLFSKNAREVVELFYEFDQPFVVDDSKFTRAFGNIATPHQEALQTTLNWYRTQIKE